jgi:hypothetical protein
MSRARIALIATALCLTLAALLPSGAAAAPAPAWTLTLTPTPANLAPGKEGEILVLATNVGGGPTTSQPIHIDTELPPGLVVTNVSTENSDRGAIAFPQCTTASQEVSCEMSDAVHPGRWLLVVIKVKVEAPEGTYETKASVSGGGASQAASTIFPTAVQAESLPFDFLPGFGAPLTNEDGSPSLLAGSHPNQQTVYFGFPTENPGDGITNDGHPRDIYVDLPRGMVGDPAASQVLCTEAELTSIDSPGCPDPSQVGVTDVTTLVGQVGNTAIASSNLYNMVPPPGAAAELATDIANVGIFVHFIVGVRSEDDYGVEAKVPDILAFGQQPIFNTDAQVWGDPTSESHDAIRGKCIESTGLKSCPVAHRSTAFLTTPGDCSGAPSETKARVDSWEEPSVQHEATYESADLEGNPVALEGCGELEFEPTIRARPTTGLTDSPSGLDVSVHQPQDTELGERSPAILKDATIRFPAGLAVNPSQAAGLGACSESQVGFKEARAGRLFFSEAPQSCPAAARIGSLEATSPLLVARNEAHEVEEDPEGNPVLEALHGSIYLAKPFANPFDSLVAVYLVVEDQKTGVVAKLAGEGRLNPQTGQITTSFKESPELPIEDIRAHIFGGPQGAFITPPTCATYTTEADLTPWSAPEGKDALPTDSFQTSAAPGGGACPTAEAQLPNAPKLSAGTLHPAAGKYSPLLFKLSREDGSQRLSRLEATLPTGLSARLAGVGICSDADIAKARSREAPEMGALEKADPSCPASTEVGSVVAGTGAGPTPFYATGHAYLAGPYKGAPLSIVTIAPAIAGPFDLGTVVVRAAVYLDPATAQGRVVSDPLPSIIDGVPLDLRSVAVRADRPEFALNPTSCAEKSFGGQAVSVLGQAAPLSARFQVGGCASLPYKPMLSTRLFGPIHRGGHPRLKSVFTAKPGEANTAAISFTFPRSEFIDQAHFRTICTRVQFAANQCPAGSVYGHARVYTPLLSYPLEGPVYLRSSSHKLPDAVLALHGPAYQPIFLEADGRVDSVKGGLRFRFESVPDAPLSKAVITAQGAKKGLFQNSTNICKGTHRATILLDAQSGKVADSQPPVKAQCKGAKKGKGAKGPKRGGSR